MGVAPTGNIFKGFTFDGEYSKDYGVYITGAGVFNAPERDVEMFAIPGRNGAFALDRGRFNNILVTYEAGVFADTAADFSEAVSDLRNFLTSRVGYCRLEDDYNSGEYREAVYKSGLEVDPAAVDTAGTFNIVFECKPQRWLKSGETELSVTSGSDVNNPTLYNASPLLEVWGSGTVSFGGQSVTVNGAAPIGQIAIGEVPYTKGRISDPSATKTITVTVTLETEYLNPGDSVFTEGNKIYSNMTVSYTDMQYEPTDLPATMASITLPTNFVYGTADSNSQYKDYVYRVTKIDTQTVYSGTISNTSQIVYDGDDTITITITGNNTNTGVGVVFAPVLTPTKTVYGVSSYMTAGTPAYIDLELGEAYKKSGGVVVSLNNTVEIGAALPVLPPGDTTFTYPNTVTQFKIVPRYWKL